MLESNSPRNSQPETHPDDERRRWPKSRRLHRMERFPYALKNSSSMTPRSGLLSYFEVALELRRWPVIECRVQALLVVNCIQELPDPRARLRQVAIFGTVHLFRFERLHEGLTGRVVPRVGLARHADADVMILQHLGVFAAGILHAPVGVMHQLRADRTVGQSHPQ